MTKEEIIDNIARLNSETWRDREEVRTEIGKLLSELKKALEQQPSEDVMAIQTQGLAEDIRCAMCTNSMKSDTGCDGGCIVDEGMYKKVMDTIENHIVPPVTPTQCIATVQFSKEDLREICNERIEIECTHGACKDCKFNVKSTKSTTMCDIGHRLYMREPSTFYCTDFVKRGDSDG